MTDGIIIIDKEKGYTSSDVVAIIKKLLKTKAGHTGTLDPDAEGVLPILLGHATKLSNLFMASDKEYIAEIILGKTTTTQDASGEVLCVRDVSVCEEQIKDTLNQFQGDIQQVPPMYSALKVGGKKLYELAREGKEIERAARTITIANISLLEVTSATSFVISVVCSKGTYIRSLAADIGEKLGCGGHMRHLCRVRTGGFKIKNAVKIGKLRELAAEGAAESVIIKMDDALELPKVTIKEEATKYLYNGNKLYKWDVQSPLNTEPKAGLQVMVYDYANNLVGVYMYEWDELKKQFCLKVDKFLKG